MKTTIVTAVLMMAVIAIIVVEATTVPALVWSGKKQLGLSKFSSLRSVLSESSTVAVFLHHQVSIVHHRPPTTMKLSNKLLRNTIP